MFLSWSFHKAEALILGLLYSGLKKLQLDLKKVADINAKGSILFRIIIMPYNVSTFTVALAPTLSWYL
ncbi:MAG: hypothetical protein AB8V10_06805 [Francisella endosymbiont of Hyalomma asiaticum]